MSEPALRCPGCGAPASSDAARCEYCGSSLATMTCGACYAPMFVGSRFCAACGAEVVRATVKSDGDMRCPRCGDPLQGLRLAAATARECTGCGGLWLDPDTLQRLVTTSDETSAVVSALGARVPTRTAAPDVVRYIPCPACGKLMNRTNFARASGVILDSCRSHGVWLDRGELQGVIAFVDHGGLARARERERDQLAEEQRRLAAMQSYTGGTSLPDGRGAVASWPFEATAPPSSPSALERLLLDALGMITSR